MYKDCNLETCFLSGASLVVVTVIKNFIYVQDHTKIFSEFPILYFDLYHSISASITLNLLFGSLYDSSKSVMTAGQALSLMTVMRVWAWEGEPEGVSMRKLMWTAAWWPIPRVRAWWWDIMPEFEYERASVKVYVYEIVGICSKFA